MNSAADAIRAEIARTGPISCARFMELALYAPGAGYYEQSRAIGRDGDFFTSVSVGPLFGDLLAFQFSRWLALLPTGNRQIVEAGAHDGRLASDVLDALARTEPSLYAGLEYWIIEPSPARAARQREALPSHALHVRWFGDWREIPARAVTGIIFSNELLDAMPVHRIAWSARQHCWIERGVTWNGARFAWENLTECTRDLSIPSLPDALLDVLPDGFVVEVGAAAVAWWRAAAARLGGGQLLTIDYGLMTEELLAPTRSAGTLRAYAGHRMTGDPLDRPGSQDLTAHVDFTALLRAGEAEGLQTDAMISQSAFLDGILAATIRTPESFGTWDAARTRAWRTLSHPEQMGRAFRVLIQSR